MSVTLSPEIERLILERMEAGSYSSADDVIRGAGVTQGPGRPNRVAKDRMASRARETLRRCGVGPRRVDRRRGSLSDSGEAAPRYAAVSPSFVLTEDALEDLDRIWQFIAGEAGTLIADRVEMRFLEACRMLSENPRAGHPRLDYTDRGLLFWAVYDYLIAYLPDTSPLQIIAVIHGRRDPTKLKAELTKR